MPRKKKTDLEGRARQVASAGDWISISEIELWEGNPRVNDGDNSATEDVAASIKRFGFIAGVTGWLRPDGSVRMVAGHTRVKGRRWTRWAKEHNQDPGLGALE
jgi:hypothetical protein